MDPEATARLMFDVDSTNAEVEQAATDLIEWLDRGGYVPPIFPHGNRESARSAAWTMRAAARALMAEDVRP